MKNLYLIDGASGTGKSDLVSYINDYQNDVTLVQKYSTRQKRDYEQKSGWELDLTIVTKSDFSKLKLDFHYSYGGEKYGFYRKDLINSLEKYSNVFVIVRNADVIHRLQKEYHYLNVIPVYIYTDLDKIKERLQQQHFHQDQIDFRIRRHQIAFEDYLKHPGLYREVLINNSSIQDFHRLVDVMLEKYAVISDIDENLIFLLMSFNINNPLLPDHAAAIKRAVIKYNSKFKCINLEDIHKGAYEISAEAKSQIRHCRLAIVDLTENRPNVYYELGFVHGISKDCIITCHQDTKPHFYPAGHRILLYKNAGELENKITEELKGIFDK